MSCTPASRAASITRSESISPDARCCCDRPRKQLDVLWQVADRADELVARPTGKVDAIQPHGLNWVRASPALDAPTWSYPTPGTDWPQAFSGASVSETPLITGGRCTSASSTTRSG
jgi:hypothetical protein